MCVFYSEILKVFLKTKIGRPYACSFFSAKVFQEVKDNLKL